MARKAKYNLTIRSNEGTRTAPAYSIADLLGFIKFLLSENDSFTVTISKVKE